MLEDTHYLERLGLKSLQRIFQASCLEGYPGVGKKTCSAPQSSHFWGQYHLPCWMMLKAWQSLESSASSSCSCWQPGSNTDGCHGFHQKKVDIPFPIIILMWGEANSLMCRNFFQAHESRTWRILLSKSFGVLEISKRDPFLMKVESVQMEVQLHYLKTRANPIEQACMK